MEFKVVKKNKKKPLEEIDLEDIAKEALEQVKTRKYTDEFLQLGIKNILTYGISFDDKDCFVVN